MHWNWNGGWSGWNWTLMLAGMVAFGGLVTWAVVALVRSPNRSQRGESDSAEQILAGRLAAGEIEGREYQHRLDALRSSKSHPTSDVGRDGTSRRPGRATDKLNT
jgi:uncharacterized membrane protein